MAAQVAQKLSLQGIFAAEAGKPLILGPCEVIMGVGKSTFKILAGLSIYLSVRRNLTWGLGALGSCSVM